MRDPLRPTVSDGGKVILGLDGVTKEQPSRCPGCGEDIGPGDEIVRHDRCWLHARCVSDHLSRMDVRDAWLVIGGQLARRPGDYSRSETRFIVGQLVRIAGGLPAIPFDGDDR